MVTLATSPQTAHPLALTAAESKDLRDRLEHALAAAQDDFIKAHVIADEKKTPIGGPDPRAVTAETLFVLARYLARAGFDLVGAAAFEEKLARLEAEIDVLTRARRARAVRVSDPTGYNCVKCGGSVADEQDCPRCY